MSRAIASSGNAARSGFDGYPRVSRIVHLDDCSTLIGMQTLFLRHIHSNTFGA